MTMFCIGMPFNFRIPRNPFVSPTMYFQQPADNLRGDDTQSWRRRKIMATGYVERSLHRAPQDRGHLTQMQGGTNNEVFEKGGY